MIIGITGSIGSGKTTVAKLFSRRQYKRLDADEINHRLLEDSDIKKTIITEFGDSFINKNNKINRGKLGDIVFNDDKKIKKLNSILHPLVIGHIKKQISEIKEKCGAKTKIVVDAPLLIETKMHDMVDKIIVVKTDIENVKKRNKKFFKEQIETILKRQLPIEKKIKHADYVIHNDGNLKNLEKQFMGIIKNIEAKK